MNATEAELIDVLERFCAGFAERDVEAVMGVFAPDPDVIVVTSEDSLLRGEGELRRFLDQYVDGPVTYSWEWAGHDVSVAGSVAWLVAEGTETAVTAGSQEQHPYRMTMVLELHEDRWRVRQIHGSSPH